MMTYQERLNPWIVVRQLPKMQRVVMGRFRTESDADGYFRFLRQHLPDAAFEVIYDSSGNHHQAQTE